MSALASVSDTTFTLVPPRITIITGDAEETRTRAYNRRDLPKWLFKWRRSDAATPP